MAQGHVSGDVRKKRKKPLPYGYTPYECENAYPALAYGLSGPEFAVYQLMLNLASVYEFVEIANEWGAWKLHITVDTFRYAVRILIKKGLVTNHGKSRWDGPMRRTVKFLKPRMPYGCPEQLAEHAERQAKKLRDIT